MGRKKLPKLDEEALNVIAAFTKVARHARNFPHPKIPIELLRSEAVRAETLAEKTFGVGTYSKICKEAFK